MRWTADRDKLECGVHRLRFSQQTHPLSFAQVTDLWIHEPDFCEFFSDQLAATPMQAFFWETPPINRGNIDRLFECVLVDAPLLYSVEAQPRAFAEHFATDDPSVQVVSFENLGGDALLVAPCPSPAAGAHLAQFLRQASAGGCAAFWRQVGLGVRRRLGNQPLWLSTCGTGVYWLHARIDSVPKYYSYRPYISWCG